MYIGDFAVGDTIHFDFNTSDATGTPITLAGTPAIEVYKDASDTQDTSGITLDVDRDSITGLHHISIDTSSDGTFYAAGSEFSVVISAGTVDGTSVVGTVVCRFSIENRVVDVVRVNGSAASVVSSFQLDVTVVGSSPSPSTTVFGFATGSYSQTANEFRDRFAYRPATHEMRRVYSSSHSGSNTTITVSTAFGSTISAGETMTIIGRNSALA